MTTHTIIGCVLVVLELDDVLEFVEAVEELLDELLVDELLLEVLDELLDVLLVDVLLEVLELVDVEVLELEELVLVVVMSSAYSSVVAK